MLSDETFEIIAAAKRLEGSRDVGSPDSFPAYLLTQYMSKYSEKTGRDRDKVPGNDLNEKLSGIINANTQGFIDLFRSLSLKDEQEVKKFLKGNLEEATKQVLLECQDEFARCVKKVEVENHDKIYEIIANVYAFANSSQEFQLLLEDQFQAILTSRSGNYSNRFCYKLSAEIKSQFSENQAIIDELYEQLQIYYPGQEQIIQSLSKDEVKTFFEDQQQLVEKNNEKSQKTESDNPIKQVLKFLYGCFIKALQFFRACSNEDPKVIEKEDPKVIVKWANFSKLDEVLKKCQRIDKTFTAKEKQRLIPETNKIQLETM